MATSRMVAMPVTNNDVLLDNIVRRNHRRYQWQRSNIGCLRLLQRLYLQAIRALQAPFLACNAHKTPHIYTFHLARFSKFQ